MTEQTRHPRHWLVGGITLGALLGLAVLVGIVAWPRPSIVAAAAIAVGLLWVTGNGSRWGPAAGVTLLSALATMALAALGLLAVVEAVGS